MLTTSVGDEEQDTVTEVSVSKHAINVVSSYSGRILSSWRFRW